MEKSSSNMLNIASLHVSEAWGISFDLGVSGENETTQQSKKEHRL